MQTYNVLTMPRAHLARPRQTLREELAHKIRDWAARRRLLVGEEGLAACEELADDIMSNDLAGEQWDWLDELRDTDGSGFGN